MQEHDARVLRGAAIPTVLVGLVAMAAALVAAGPHGLFGAVAGTVLVVGFFAVSALVVSLTGQRRPHLLLPVAFLVYTTKVGVLAVVLVLFRGTTALDGTAFAMTTLACVVTWLAGQAVASVRVRRLTVEPVEDDGAPTGTKR